MDQREYVRRLLNAYRATPGTCGIVRRPDRLLAGQLHERGVPLTAIENALALAALRRLVRPDDAMPLPVVRSLAYFLPVIDEVLATEVDPRYYQHVRNKLQRLITAA
ncbi:MAG TPA: hypothetical protein VHJ19_10035 [Gammaproteobacteria bacterium]|nr:hypothetical protein [Gammaproteobacteria bacterium]